MQTEYCSSVFIIDEKRQKVLLIYHKKYQNWVQPGGRLKTGEKPEDGAIRKALEETGIKIKLVNTHPFMVEEYNNYNGHFIDYQFLATPIDDLQEPVLNEQKCYAIDWFSLDELNSIPLFPDVKTKVRMFLKPHFNH